MNPALVLTSFVSLTQGKLTRLLGGRRKHGIGRNATAGATPAPAASMATEAGNEMCYRRAARLGIPSSNKSLIAVLIVGELRGFGLVNRNNSFERLLMTPLSAMEGWDYDAFVCSEMP